MPSDEEVKLTANEDLNDLLRRIDARAQEMCDNLVRDEKWIARQLRWAWPLFCFSLTCAISAPALYFEKHHGAGGLVLLTGAWLVGTLAIQAKYAATRAPITRQYLWRMIDLDKGLIRSSREYYVKGQRNVEYAKALHNRLARMTGQPLPFPELADAADHLNR